MKIILPSAEKSGFPVPSIPLGVTVTALSGLLLLSGCGPSDKAPSSPSESPTPSAIAEPPENEPPASPVPGATASPQAAVPEATPPKTLYVVTAFEAVSELGTHQFPVGAKVNVMEEDGDDYLVEYHGVAVRNGREFFSETATVESEPPPVEASPVASPVASPGSETPPGTGLAGPEATPDPNLAAEEKKSAELLGEIRSINDEIRRAEDAQKMESSPDAETEDSSEIQRLKKQRDALSEDLTDFAKP